MVVAWWIFGEDSRSGTQVTAHLLFLVTSLAALRLIGRGALGQCTPLTVEFRELLLAVPAGCAGFGVSFAYVALIQAAQPSEGAPDAVAVPTSMIFSIIVLAPLIEEWMDRGILWTATRRIAGTPTTIVVTAALFAFSHGLAGLPALPHRFVGGLILGYLRARSGSLVPGILAHFIWNLLAVTI